MAQGPANTVMGLLGYLASILFCIRNQWRVFQHDAYAFLSQNLPQAVTKGIVVDKGNGCMGAIIGAGITNCHRLYRTSAVLRGGKQARMEAP